MSTTAPVILKMQAQIRAWEAAADDKALFLNCYRLMTDNMLTAIHQQEFKDGPWVGRLLELFADYYFVALEAYERDPAAAPPIWRHAHDATRDPQVNALQKLLLGVNAHINYDLVFTLVDLLLPEWDHLSAVQRAGRYADHCQVNAVIGRTIDAVQNQVLDPAMPMMDYLDKLLGPLDELLISRLITQWRDGVWLNAMDLLSAGPPPAPTRFSYKIEREALKTARMICHRSATGP